MIKKLFKHSFVYSIGSVSLQLANFLLVPLYAKYLTPAEYGIQSLFIILISILSISIDLGLKSSINRVYFDYKTEIEKKILTGNAFIFLNIFGLIIILLCVEFKKPITFLLTGSSGYIHIYQYILWDIFFGSSFNLFLSFLRVRNQTYKYVILSITKLLSLLALTIFFVAFKREGLLGIFKGGFLSSLIFYIIILPSIIKEVKFSINIKMLKNMISFGLPFVPASIFSFILTSSDRYILKIFSNIQEVGLYAMGYRFGLIINVFVVQPFVLAWPQQIVPISQKENAREIFCKIVTYFIVVSGFITTVLLIFLDDVYHLILTPNFFASKSIVPMIAVSYIFNGLYYIFLVGVFLEKKTKYPPLIFAFASILNVVLNFYFIPRWGMKGAAATTFISYLTIPIVTYYISNKFFNIDVEYFRISKLIVIFLGIYSISKMEIFPDHFYMTIFKLVVTLSFPIFLYIVNFYEKKEKNEIVKVYFQIKKLCRC